MNEIVSQTDVGEYCRNIETYLCRKNDGHLIRITGPSFDVVGQWASAGVPLKVAYAGIDRYFERYYRKGPRRRPVRIDFCEADVLDVFDEWRRATGVTPGETRASGDETVAGEVNTPGAPTPSTARRGPSLPEHLERVLVRLSSLRATNVLGTQADPIVDAVSSELDAVRATAVASRGERRKATLARLTELDRQMMELAMQSMPPAMLAALRSEVAGDLEHFRGGMAPDAYERALAAATTRLLRERLRLPELAIT